MPPAPLQSHARRPAHTALVVPLVALLGTSTYPLLTLLRQHRELGHASEEAQQLRITLVELRTSHEAVQTQLVTARAELSKLTPPLPVDEPLERAGEAWIGRVSHLKRLASEQPDRLPELDLLTENDWYAIAKEADLAREESVREAQGKLRDAAKRALGRLMREAVIRYAQEHGGFLPPDTRDLATLLPAGATPPMLARYEVLAHGALANVPKDEPVVAERRNDAGSGDTRLVVTARAADLEDLNKVSDRELRQALVAYRASNDGRWPDAPPQLLPFFRTPLTSAAQKSFLEQPTSAFTEAELNKLLNPQ